ncbi:site-specific DNA-methyltransferase [Massilia sp. Root351]|jgi:site-specific DNA-methyltransferase (adenine-specific)|uniref:DNA-methyltransferase n=1 Tax=Massilia sp. Root351 TaxID=1736522 RepID=UPI0009EC5CA8
MSDWLNQVFCEDALAGLARIPDGAVDLILTDPPYNLGKDYGNASDQQTVEEYLRWTEQWIDAALPKLKPNGSLYIFLTWRFSPEIFVMLKQRMTMMNEIIWDRRVPSMGGSVRSYSSVHDTVGFFVGRKDYYFDLDAVRIPYDAETKKARSRSIFIGAKWLEVGYNPKDVWSVSRLHREHPERADHPTQKPLEIIERMVKASCPPGGVVLDLFMGSGTTALAARRCGRQFVGFELNPQYCAIINQRLAALETLEALALAAAPDAPAKPKSEARPKAKAAATAKAAAPAKNAAIKKAATKKAAIKKAAIKKAATKKAAAAPTAAAPKRSRAVKKAPPEEVTI